MNKDANNNQLNINENELRFEQMKTIMRMSGADIDDSMKALIQPYIDGIETEEQTIERLQSLLAEVK